MIDLNQPSGTKPSSLESVPSFEVIYNRHYARVYHYLRAHLDNEEDASDLAQQVFFQVWLHLPSYRSERGSLSTWILSIAHHRLIDFYRALRCSISWEALPERMAMDLSPEEMLLSAESQAQVKALLDALSPFERDLLTMRFVARLPIAKIAAIIGKSEEATKKQLTRLIQRLQQLYRRQDLEDVLRDLLEPVSAISLVILYEVEHLPLTVQH